MIDLHLINGALAGLGVGVAAVLLITAAIFAIVALGRRSRGSHHGQLAPTSTARVAPFTVNDQKHQVKEPALR